LKRIKFPEAAYFIMRKAKGPAYHVKRLERIAEKDVPRWREHLERAAGQERMAREKQPFCWIDDRTYKKHYSPFFREALGKFFLGKGRLEILDALAMVPMGKGRPLVVLEDGPGKGHFLVAAGKGLAEKRIPNRTLGLAFEKSPMLAARERKGRIRQIITGPAELFVPNKPVDAIVSFYGSITYALPEMRKEHLLKFAQSLRKGGIMMAGFDLNALKGINLLKYGPESFLRGVERAFAKRGFRAKIYPKPETFAENSPSHILIVQRTNSFPAQNSGSAAAPQQFRLESAFR